jgi:hypothetical protein
VTINNEVSYGCDVLMSDRLLPAIKPRVIQLESFNPMLGNYNDVDVELTIGNKKFKLKYDENRYMYRPVKQ